MHEQRTDLCRDAIIMHIRGSMYGGHDTYAMPNGQYHMELIFLNDGVQRANPIGTRCMYKRPIRSKGARKINYQSPNGDIMYIYTRQYVCTKNQS